MIGLEDVRGPKAEMKTVMVVEENLHLLHQVQVCRSGRWCLARHRLSAHSDFCDEASVETPEFRRDGRYEDKGLLQWDKQDNHRFLHHAEEFSGDDTIGLVALDSQSVASDVDVVMDRRCDARECHAELQAVEGPTLLQLNKYITGGTYCHLVDGVSRDRVQVMHACMQHV